MLIKFDPKKFPDNIPADWIAGANRGLVMMRGRLVDKIEYGNSTHFEFCCRWIEIYLQSHIRRALNLIEGGLAEIRADRPVLTAFCARALIEDGAMVYHFIRRINSLLDKKDTTALEQFVFSKALQSRDKRILKKHGEEYRATNILTLIDEMTKEHPKVRPSYDDLSEVCHPNRYGVLWHYSTINGDAIEFDDRTQSGAALCSLLFGALVFLGEETAMRRLDRRLDEMRGLFQ